MITHAGTLPKWQRSGSRTAYELSNLWQSLLGLDRWGLKAIKQETFNVAIVELLPSYREWATHWLGYHNSADNLARFLRQPSAVGILSEGMAWLRDLANRFERDDWRNRTNLAAVLIDLIEYWWNLRRGDSPPEQEFAVATDLLKLLSEQHIPRALELQDHIARAR